MATNRIALVPWHKEYCLKMTAEYEANNDNIDKTHYKRTWTVINYDTPGKPLAKMSDARLHICGHGAVGKRTISAGGKGQYVRHAHHMPEILEMLGLPKDYRGTIAADVCWGGVGDGDEICFARALAAEMKKAGYSKVKVIGYTGILVANYREQKYGKKKHKYFHRMVDFYKEVNGQEVLVSQKSKYRQKTFSGDLKDLTLYDVDQDLLCA